jgi:hypothetical protein
MAFARQMAGQLLTALGVWVGVVALISVAGMVILGTQDTPSRLVCIDSPSCSGIACCSCSSWIWFSTCCPSPRSVVRLYMQ